MGSGPKYPNQQLRSVSLETYFPGQLGSLAGFGHVQKKVKKDFPNLFVPNAIPGEALSLRPYQLRSEDGSKSLALSLNQATYVSYDYPGFDAFRSDAMDPIEVSLKEVGAPSLNRVVYRYENEIGMSRGIHGTLGVEALFPGVLPPVFATGGSGDSLKLGAGFEHRWSEGDLIGTQAFNAQMDDGVPGGAVLRLSVIGTVEDVKLDDLGAAVDKAHEISVNLFEKLISDAFRKFISNGDD